MDKILSYKQRIIDQLGNIKDSVILDYGCGRGDFINLLLKSNNKPKLIYAIDSSLDMINHIKHNFPADLVKPIICKDPQELIGLKFDKIICHNVLECVDDKLKFINAFANLLAANGIAIISHHDFDSSIYNSSNPKLTRKLIHEFADTQQEWQDHSDGQVGRKIPGLIAASIFKEKAKVETWRIVEREFKPGYYGFLLANMIAGFAKPKEMSLLTEDLLRKCQQHDYYFAIDLVVAILESPK